MDSFYLNMEEDEEVLWEYRKKEDPLEDYHVEVFFLAAPIIFLIIFIPVVFSNPELHPYLDVFWVIFIIMILFELCVIIMTWSDFKKKIRIMTILQLNKTELKNYEAIYTLTNKNWMQKSAKIIDFKKPKEVYQGTNQKKDLLIVRLDQIQSFYAYESSKSKLFFISFFYDYEQYNPVGGDWQVIEYPRFKNLLDIVKKILKIHRIETISSSKHHIQKKFYI